MFDSLNARPFFHGVSVSPLKAIGWAFAALAMLGVPLRAGTQKAPARGRGEVVFIDSGVPEPALLAAAIRPGAEKILLDPAREAWPQINAALKGRRGLEAVHLLTHGAPGELQLGGHRILKKDLPGLDFAPWRAALAPEGQVLLYGCEVARGRTGRDFVEAWGAATGVQVAASVNATGASGQGGDWVLEYATGRLPRRPLLRKGAGYPGLLPAPRVISGNDGSGDIYVRPGGNSYSWTYGVGGTPEGAITQISYHQVNNLPAGATSGPEDQVLTLGTFQYSTDGGAHWTDYAAGAFTPNQNTFLPNFVTVSGRIWRFVHNDAANTTGTNSVGWAYVVNGANWGTSITIHPDNPPSDIQTSSTSREVLQGTAAGTTLMTLTPVDTGMTKGGAWVLDSQSVSNLFTLTPSASDNTAVLKLGTGVLPADGQTATITVRYCDIFQTDASGQPLSGQGISKTYTYTFRSLTSQALAGFGSDIVVNATTAGSQDSPAVARLSNGNFAVVWHSEEQGDPGYGSIIAQILKPDGTKIGNEIQVSPAGNGTMESYPSVAALSGGRFVVAYTVIGNVNSEDNDIRYVIVGSDGTPGTEKTANTDVDRYEDNPVLTALDDGSFMIGWLSYILPNYTPVDFRVRRFSGTDGSPLAGPEVVVSNGTSDYPASLAALPGGGYLAAYVNTADGNNVLGMVRMNANTAFQVADHVSGFKVAALGGGGFVALWTPSNSSCLWFQRFLTNGAPVGSAVQVQAATGGTHFNPALAALDDGGFLVTWQSDTGDYNNNGILGRRFDATGNPTDAQEFEINEHRLGDQNAPVAAPAGGNRFIALWNDGVLDGSSYGVVARILGFNNTAPLFAGSITTLTVNQNVAATDIRSLLHASDPDSGQILTWSQGAAPDHGGSLLFTGTTASAGGSDLTPGGTLTYTPASGFTGTETFTVQVSDGTATASRQITVTVRAPQSITFGAPGNKAFGSNPTLGATASSGLTVSFLSTTPGVCTITSQGVLTTVALGTCTIQADQAGNATYMAAPSTTQTFSIVAAVPGAPTAVSAAAGSGQASVSFTAPAFDGGAPVTGYIATSNPGGFSASGASSPLLVTGLTNGTAYTFTVRAANAAGTGTPSASSPAVTPLGAQTLTFANPGTQLFGTSPTLTASSDSHLAVAFTSTTPSVCTITSGGALSFLSTGTCTIQADQPGNSAWSAAPAVTQGFTVTAVAPGAPVIGSATPGSGQASVSFTAPSFNGGAALTGYVVTAHPGGLFASGTGSPILVTGLSNGTAYTFSVTASNGSGTSAPSASSSAVTPMAVQTLTFLNPGAQNFGTTPLLSAASDSSLPVSFQSVTPSVCTVSAAGSLTFLTTGTCSIQADAAGDASHLPAPSVTRSFAVNPVAPGAPVITGAVAGDAQATVSFAPPAFTGGASVTGYTLTASPGGRSVSGAASPLILSGLTNGTTYTFTVTATGTAGTGPASSASAPVVPRAVQSITFAGPSAQTFGTHPTLAATASSGQSVSFRSTTTSVCTVSGAGELSFLSAGTCTIEADQAGNDTYLPAPTVSRSFAVLPGIPGAPTAVIATPGDGEALVVFVAPASTGGAPLTGFTAASSPGGFTATGAGSPLRVTGLANGVSYTFTVTATGPAGTGPASAPSSAVVPRNAQSITFPDPGARTFGTNPALAASASSGLAVSFSTTTPAVCTVTPGGVLTFLATGTCSIQADQAGNSTYLPAATVSRSFQVNAAVPGMPTLTGVSAGNRKATVSFTAPAFTGGAAITQYVVTSSPGGFTASGSASPLTVTGLTNGVATTFRVVAVNAAGAGAPSGDSAPVTPAPASPLAPSMTSATAGDGMATVSFAAPADDGGSPVTRYVATSTPGGFTGEGSANPIVVTGLRNGQAYSFTVSAANAVGTGPESAASNDVIPNPGGTMLVVHDGTPGPQAAALQRLTEQGTQVHGLTVSSVTAVPASLDAYDLVWDIRSGESTPLTSQDQQSFLAFLRKGGQLMLTGESLDSGLRDLSLAALVQAAGGGTLTLAPPSGTAQIPQTPFGGPLPLPDYAYLGAAGATALGHGTALTKDGVQAGAVVWVPGTLSQALAGGLITVFDGDFLLAPPDDRNRAFLGNLLNFMIRSRKSSPEITALELPAAGTFREGAVLTFRVHTSAPVTVTGTPRLPLAIGPNAAAATYVEGSGSAILVFQYTVRSGDNGSVVPGAALDLTQALGASSTIQDAGGFPARVTLPAPAGTGLVVDTAAPGVPVITSITGNLVTGTAEPHSTVSLFLGSTLLGTVTADAGGNWSYTLPVNGTGNLTVSAADGAGNGGAVSSPVPVDTRIPVAHDVTARVMAGASDQPVALSITEVPATSVAVAEAPSHGAASARGTAITYTPAPGFWGTDRFTYVAANACGVSLPATVDVTVLSNRTPSVQVAALPDGATTAIVLATVAGSVTSDNGLDFLSLNGAKIPVLPDGRFRAPVRLAVGANPLTLVAVDKAGLSSTLTRTLLLDPAAPVLNLASPVDGAVFLTASQTVTGSVAAAPGSEGIDPVASVSCSFNGEDLQAATLNGNSFTFPVTLVPGGNTLRVSVKTVAGKTAELFRSFTLGSSGSALTVTDPGQDLLLTATSYRLKGTVATTAPPVTLVIKVGDQTYTPTWVATGTQGLMDVSGPAQTVTLGTFEQMVPLNGIQTWTAVVNATDAQNRTETAVRNLVTAASTSPALYTLADALRALQIANGSVTATAEDLSRLDLASATGARTPDGVIGLEDAVLVLWLASGQNL